MGRNYTRLEKAGLVFGLWMLVVSGIPAARTPGYLSTVGPAPLRFQPLPRSNSVVVLPPLIAHSNPAPVIDPISNPLPEEPDFAPETNQLSEVIAKEPIAAVMSNSVPQQILPPTPFATVPAQTQIPNLDSQLLLRYLTPPSTNAAINQIVLPLFVPPVPPATTPSSKATYRN